MGALELILMRHGEAEHARLGAPDFDRPLTDHGKKEAMGTAMALFAAGLRPSHAWVSQAARALQTAHQVAQIMGLGQSSMTVTPALYHASVETVVTNLVASIGSHQRVMVVAHNPTLSFLATQLSGQTVQLVTGEAVLLTLEGFSWAEGLRASHLWTVAGRWRGGQDIPTGR